MDLQEKNIAVIGMGLTGLATANFLSERGARVTLMDRNSRKSLGGKLAELRKQVQTCFETSSPPADSEMIVISPGVDIQAPFLESPHRQGIPVISEIELASRFNKTPIIAITGTNGKTTTTTLVEKLLEGSGKTVNVCGNIGTPFISIVDKPDSDFIVLEVSSFQLEGIRHFRPQIAAILNITPDHLDRHKTLGRYAALKGRIFENQNLEDALILNADDPQVMKLADSKDVQKFYFSLKKEVEYGAWLDGEKMVLRLHEKCLKVIKTRNLLPAMRNQVENCLAAMIAAALGGADPNSFTNSLGSFAGLEHRLEWVRTLRGIDFINDSKGTNVGSVKKSLNSFDRPIILILGGQDKDSDFNPLLPLLESKVKKIILIGEVREKIKDLLSGTPPFEEAGTLSGALDTAVANSQPGDVVLLSPGCASFDMFENYMDRGNQFKHLVQNLY